MQNALKQAAKDFIKELIWVLMSHYSQGPKKNICLFSTRRGGSTLLMELIAANRGVTYSNQPFSIYTATRTQLQYLPIKEKGQLTSMDEEEEKQVFLYLTKLMDGTLKVHAPWRFWRRDFSAKSNRIVIKILDAKSIIDWIDKNFQPHIVYSTRHPIPSTLSILRNKWPLTAKAYLVDEEFVNRFLEPRQVAAGWDLLRKGSLFEKHILNWCLENIAPLKLMETNDHWMYVSYETLMMHPEKVVDDLINGLDLSDRDRMLRVIGRPSISTRERLSTRDTCQNIKSGNRRALISGWRNRVSDEEEKAAMRILDRFGIQLYQYKHDFSVWDNDLQ